MSTCTEFSVFHVKEENKQRVIELSEMIFAEMNKDEKVILSYDILENTKNKEELSWYLLWINKEVAKSTTEKWPTFPRCVCSPKNQIEVHIDNSDHLGSKTCGTSTFVVRRDITCQHLKNLV